jgi:hypothetical protein
MGKLVQGLMGGGGAKRKEAAQRNEQQVNIARQQQDAQTNAAQTESQLNRARKTPRGRRALIGEVGSKLG